MKIRAAPRLLGWRLGKVHAPSAHFLKEAVNIGDLNGGKDQELFPRGEFRKIGLVDATKVQTRGPSTRDRAIEGRRPIEKIDLETEFIPIKRGALGNVTNEQDRDERLQDDIAHQEVHK
jgi:hypothetical protein